MWFKRKKLSILFILALLINAVLAPLGLAEEETVDKPLIVSLGDSITEGFNLEDKSKAFPYLLGPGCFEIENLGVPGATSEELLEKFDSPVVFSENTRSFTESIEQSSVITITIGSNDLLAPAWPIINAKEPLTDPAQQKALGEAIIAAAGKLGENLADIIANIRVLNPDALILFYNIYNPFAPGGEPNSFDMYLHVLGETVVNQVNTEIMAPLGALPGTVVLDAYSAFHGKQTDYIIPGDIHPTEAGHQQLATLANGVIIPLLAQKIEVDIKPLITEQTENPVTISVNTNFPGSSIMKWLSGEKTVEDLRTSGTEFDGSFEVTENGVYSVYLNACGIEKVSTIEITNIVEPKEEPPVEEEPPTEEPPTEEEPPAEEEPPTEEEPPAEEKPPVKEEPVKEDPKETPEKQKPTKSGNKLPNTASSMYNLFVAGVSLLVIGAGLFILYIRKSKIANS